MSSELEAPAGPGPSPLRPYPFPLPALAAAVGLSAANPFYGQVLTPAVAADLHRSESVVLLGPMVTQLGLALGLLLILPLGDVLERRSMLTALALGLALACAGVALSTSFPLLLLAWFALGLCALIPSSLPPYLASFTSDANRGRMLGVLLSGQFSGILLSRSFSGLLAQVAGWRAIYWVSAGFMVAVALLFATRLPRQLPREPIGYGELQRSLLALWCRYRRLRKSCISQALLFGSFMVLWSALALHLAAPPWRLGPAATGGFGLVGLTSILAAPWVGRAVDRWGASRLVVGGVATTLGAVALLAVGAGSLGWIVLGLMALDLGVQGSFVANQARVLALDPAARSRMSGLLFMTAYGGAAICSALMAHFWPSWQWQGTCGFAAALLVVALVIEALPETPRLRWGPVRGRRTPGGDPPPRGPAPPAAGRPAAPPPP